MINSFEAVLLVLIFASPAFVLPIVIGPIILRWFNDDLGKLAAWFTLKPLIATPLWVITLGLLDELRLAEDITQALSLMPAIALTLIIVWRFKGLFKTETRIAFVLTGADAIRWLNTFAWMQSGGHARMTDPFLMAGWILPNAYAIMAIVMMWLRARQEKRLA